MQASDTATGCRLCLPDSPMAQDTRPRPSCAPTQALLLGPSMASISPGAGSPLHGQLPRPGPVRRAGKKRDVWLGPRGGLADGYPHAVNIPRALLCMAQALAWLGAALQSGQCGRMLALPWSISCSSRESPTPTHPVQLRSASCCSVPRAPSRARVLASDFTQEKSS